MPGLVRIEGVRGSNPLRSTLKVPAQSIFFELISSLSRSFEGQYEGRDQPTEGGPENHESVSGGTLPARVWVQVEPATAVHGTGIRETWVASFLPSAAEERRAVGRFLGQRNRLSCFVPAGRSGMGWAAGRHERAPHGGRSVA